MNAHAAQYPIRTLCATLRVSRSGYYAWLGRAPSARAQADACLLPHILAAHQASRGLYGSPRVHAELRAGGIACGRHRVARLMRRARIRGVMPLHRRRPATVTGRALASNTLNRQFQVEMPDTVWAGDITVLWTGGGWLYLAVVMDLYARRIVGWAMDTRMTEQLPMRALNMALERRQPTPGLVHHSDQGSQYASAAFQQLLQAHGIHCSMSRKGDPYDNACVESFFSSLKRELAIRQRFPTRERARAAVFEYIEVFYNRRRRHSTLGYLSPIEFERRQGLT